MTTVVIELPYNAKAGQAVERLNGGLRQDRTFSPTLGLTLGLGCPDLPRHQTCPQTTHRDAHVAINLSDEAKLRSSTPNNVWLVVESPV